MVSIAVSGEPPPAGTHTETHTETHTHTHTFQDNVDSCKLINYNSSIVKNLLEKLRDHKFKIHIIWQSKNLKIHIICQSKRGYNRLKTHNFFFKWPILEFLYDILKLQLIQSYQSKNASLRGTAFIPCWNSATNPSAALGPLPFRTRPEKIFLFLLYLCTCWDVFQGFT